MLFSFSSLVYGGGGDDAGETCPCDLIKQGQFWENFHCIKTCEWEEDFNSRQALLRDKCFIGKKAPEKQIQKKEVNGIKMPLVLWAIIKELAQWESAKEPLLKKTCPGCYFISQRDTQVRFSSQKRLATCPANYLKSQSYSKSFKEEEQNTNSCREKLNKQFQSYINKILLGQNLEGKRLWQDCPKNCAFQTDSSSRINTKTCSGYLNLTVHCGHKIKKKYHISSQYKAYLQCPESLKNSL